MTHDEEQDAALVALKAVARGMDDDSARVLLEWLHKDGYHISDHNCECATCKAERDAKFDVGRCTCGLREYGMAIGPMASCPVHA